MSRFAALGMFSQSVLDAMDDGDPAGVDGGGSLSSPRGSGGGGGGGIGRGEGEEEIDEDEEEDEDEDGVSAQTAVSPAIPEAENFYEWRELFPELQLLYDNVAVLVDEASRIQDWTPWPEDHFALGGVTDWTVFPFLHTFPALDTSKSTWLQSTTIHCPNTTSLLRQVPNIRTALFSRLGPGTNLSCHTGWADLANYVLRCHVCLKVPAGQQCGLYVNGEVRHHEQGQILVFDDSKRHKAFNESSEERIVLIVDLLRPEHIPLGRAKGGHTQELDAFVSRFK